MRKLIRILYLSVFTLFLYCQNLIGQDLQKVDSLTNLLSSDIAEEQQLDVYNELSSELWRARPHQTVEYAKKALKLAEKLKDPGKEALAQFNLGSGFYQSDQVQLAKKAIDKAQQLFEHLRDSNGIAKTWRFQSKLANYLNQKEASTTYINQFLDYYKSKNDFAQIGLGYVTMFWGVFSGENPDSAFKVATKGIFYLEKSTNYSYLETAYCNLAFSHRVRSQMGKAMEAFEKALAVSEKHSDIITKAITYRQLGHFYSQQMKFQEAIEMYLQSKNLYKSCGNEEGYAVILNSIGGVYLDLEQWDLAQQNLIEANAIFLKIDSKYEIGGNYYNLSTVSMEKGDYDLAESYLIKCLDLLKMSKLSHHETLIFRSLGTLYQRKQEWNKAIRFLEKAKSNALHSKHNSMLSTLYSDLGNLYLRINNNVLAIENGRAALEIALQINSLVSKKDAYNVLNIGYSRTGQFEKAYDYLLKHTMVQDSIEDEENNKELNELLSKYETEKKEQEIVLLNKEKEIQQTQYEARFERELLIRWGLIILAISLIALGWVVRRSFRQKIQFNNELLQKQDEINRQRIHELQQKQQAKLLEAMTRVEEKERFRIAKDLHDGIGGALAGVKLNLKMAIKAIPGSGVSFSPITKEIDDIYREVRTISHNLTPPALSKLPFTQLLIDFVNRLKINESIQIAINLFPQNDLNELEHQVQLNLYRILQECINNVLKHANAGQVHIDLAIIDDSVNLFIEDDGEGFDIENSNQGIGLNNIKSRVASLGGEIEIDAHPSRGTAINITVPARLYSLTSNSNENGVAEIV